MAKPKIDSRVGRVPSTATTAKVWALVGYDRPTSKNYAAATFAINKGGLPFGGWSSQGMTERAVCVALAGRTTLAKAAREWYADQPMQDKRTPDLIAQLKVIANDPAQAERLGTALNGIGVAVR